MTQFTTLNARAILMLRDHIDTDQIIPARFLKVVDREGLGRRLFYDWRYLEDGQDRLEFELNRAESQGAEILVSGENFGCGSSREHAPWALVGWGLRAIVARSFADIFQSNALKNGLVPIALDDEQHSELVESLERAPSQSLTVDLQASELRVGELCFKFHVDGFARHCLLSGIDQLGYIQGFESNIRGYEATHHASA